MYLRLFLSSVLFLVDKKYELLDFRVRGRLPPSSGPLRALRRRPSGWPKAVRRPQRNPRETPQAPQEARHREDRVDTPERAQSPAVRLYGDIIDKWRQSIQTFGPQPDFGFNILKSLQ